MGSGLTHFCMRLNEGEKCIGLRQLLVDGYDAASQTVYKFHGCYWHGRECWLTAKKFTSMEVDPNSPQSIKFLDLIQQQEKRKEDN